MRIPGFLSRSVVALHSPAPHLVVNLDATRPSGTLAQPAPAVVQVQVASLPAAETDTATMNLQTIEQKVVAESKTFLGWAAKEVRKIEGELPTVIRVADQTLGWARLVLPGILVADGQPVAAAAASEGITVAQNIINEASNDLTTIQGAVYDAGPNPTITSAIQSVQTNLGTLETAGHIKSDAAKTLTSKIVSALGELVLVLTPQQQTA